MTMSIAIRRRRSRPVADRLGRLIAEAHRLVRLWRRRSRDRRQLAFATLDPRILEDIGLTREEAQRITRKPFWRE